MASVAAIVTTVCVVEVLLRLLHCITTVVEGAERDDVAPVWEVSTTGNMNLMVIAVGLSILV